MLGYQTRSLTVLQRRGFSLAATKSILHDSRAFLRTLVLYARTYTSWKDAALKEAVAPFQTQFQQSSNIHIIIIITFTFVNVVHMSISTDESE
jgi:hypothetical protein